MTKHSKSVVSDSYRRDYKADRLAKAISAAVRGEDGKIDVARLEKLARDNAVEFTANRNAGLLVMTVSTVLRARLRHGGKVTIGGKAFRKGGRS